MYPDTRALGIECMEMIPRIMLRKKSLTLVRYGKRLILIRKGNVMITTINPIKTKAPGFVLSRLFHPGSNHHQHIWPKGLAKSL